MIVEFNTSKPVMHFHDRSNPVVAWSMAVMIFSRINSSVSKGGSLSRFMQVEAVGSRVVSAPERWMQKGGFKY